jgi:hypothetical protein
MSLPERARWFERIESADASRWREVRARHARKPAKVSSRLAGEYESFLLFRNQFGFRDGGSCRGVLSHGTIRLIESFLRPDSMELASAAATGCVEAADWCLSRGASPEADDCLAMRAAIMSRDTAMVDLLKRRGFSPGIREVVLSYRMHVDIGYSLAPEDLRWALPAVMKYQYTAKFVEIADAHPPDVIGPMVNKYLTWLLMSASDGEFLEAVLERFQGDVASRPFMADRPADLKLPVCVMMRRDVGSTWRWFQEIPDWRDCSRMSRNFYAHLNDFEDWILREEPDRIPAINTVSGVARVFLYGFILPWEKDCPLLDAESACSWRWVGILEDQSATTRFDRAWEFFLGRAGYDPCRYPRLLSLFVCRAVNFDSPEPLRRITDAVADCDLREALKRSDVHFHSPLVTESYFELARRRLWIHLKWCPVFRSHLPLDVLDERFLEMLRNEADDLLAGGLSQGRLRHRLRSALSKGMVRSVGFLITESHLRNRLMVPFVRHLVVTYRHNIASVAVMLFGFLGPRNRRRVFSVWWIPRRADRFRELVWTMMNGRLN